ncbi:MAG: hypothetical protein K6A44_04265 [bacterium]|nr:hypothetical protein [bacterium]
MKIGAVNMANISYGSKTANAATKEKHFLSESFRNMLKSPIFDAEAVDIDEIAYRSGIEDFHSDTMLRTFQNNADNAGRAAISGESPKALAMQITSGEQARNVEKFIAELNMLKFSNPTEAFNIGGQISRLKRMLDKYYKSLRI